ncbi:hypothetical protein CR513_17357, partial [Mucuna pruriens]
MPSRTIENCQYDFAIKQQEEGIIPPRPTPSTTQGPEITKENMQACKTTFMGAQGPGPTPTMVIHSDRQEDLQSHEIWKYLEERLKAIEGIERYRFEAANLCLVLDVIIPHKFKFLDFDKYIGNSCPRNHLISYCRKMVAHTHDDKLLIHLFQESLAEATYGWYLNLEKGQIRTWKDLAEAFLKQHKYNEELAPERTQLQKMDKKETKTFKEYAQRWREVAAHIQPPLSKKEIVTMFIDTL